MLFDAVKRFFRQPHLDEEALMSRASLGIPGPRGRKIFFANESFHRFKPDGSWELISGFTAPGSGNSYISRFISIGPRDKLATVLRHESVHSMLTPRSPWLNALVGTLRKRSHLYLYLEESAAQTYATRSLRQGIRFPLKYKYVKPVRLAAESIPVVGGIAAMTFGLPWQDD